MPHAWLAARLVPYSTVSPGGQVALGPEFHAQRGFVAWQPGWSFRPSAARVAPPVEITVFSPLLPVRACSLARQSAWRAALHVQLDMFLSAPRAHAWLAIQPGARRVVLPAR